MHIDISLTSLKRLLVFLLLSFSFVVTADNLALKELGSWDSNIIKIHNSEGKIYKLDVYIADSNYKRKKGLMYIENLPINHGMLFKFDSPRVASMWMKNTYLPLSVAFINDSRQIVHIANMHPQTTKIHRSPVAVRYALEVNLGWFETNNVKPGALMRFGITGDSISR